MPGMCVPGMSMPGMSILRRPGSCLACRHRSASVHKYCVNSANKPIPVSTTLCAPTNIESLRRNEISGNPRVNCGVDHFARHT
jgi:hypothetical protein